MMTNGPKRIGDLIALKIGLSIRVTVPLVLFGSAAAFSVLYALLPEGRDVLRFIGAAIGVATALQSAYFAKRALETSVHDRQLAAASEYFWKFYFELNEVRTRFRGLHLQLTGKNAQTIIALIEQDDNAAIVTAMLNFWEGVGYSVRHGRVPIELMCDLMGSACITAFDSVQPWLQEFRRARKQPTAFEHFEWLCREIRLKKLR